MNFLVQLAFQVKVSMRCSAFNPVTVCTCEPSPAPDLPVTLIKPVTWDPYPSKYFFFCNISEALTNCSACVCVCVSKKETETERQSYYSPPLVMKTQKPPALADTWSS